MKNETAIREIESLDYYLQNHTNDYSEKSHTAMMMAIEALEQEPIVRCKDCIHAENMTKPWADGRQIVFCWKHGKERFTTSDWYCANGERKTE